MKDKTDLLDRCRIIGDGLPIILAHGMGGPIVWKKTEEILSNDFKVIIPTFPGYLEEDGIIHYTDDLYVEFLDEVRQKLGLTQLNLIGLSMGGRTVTNYSIKHPDHVASLVIIDSIGIGNMSPLVTLPIVKRLFPFLLKKLLANPRNSMKLAVSDFVNTDSEIFEENIEFFTNMMKNETIRTNFANILAQVGIKNKSWEQYLQKIHMPTMILWAKEDKTAPVKWGYQFKELISNSQLYILDDYKHMAIMEQPDFFTDKISAFIKERAHFSES